MRDDGQDRLSLSITLADGFTRYEHIETVLKPRIKEHEDYRELPYQLKYDDATGKTIQENFKTVGYGHKIIPGEILPTTKEGFEELFNADMDKAIKGVETFDLPPDLPDECYGVVVEMAYQMGVEGTRKFDETLKYLRRGDYVGASVEMLDSDWATQTPFRAVALSKIVANCE